MKVQVTGEAVRVISPYGAVSEWRPKVGVISLATMEALGPSKSGGAEGIVVVTIGASLVLVEVRSDGEAVEVGRRDVDAQPSAVALHVHPQSASFKVNFPASQGPDCLVCSEFAGQRKRLGLECREAGCRRPTLGRCTTRRCPVRLLEGLGPP